MSTPGNSSRGRTCALPWSIIFQRLTRFRFDRDQTAAAIVCRDGRVGNRQLGYCTRWPAAARTPAAIKELLQQRLRGGSFGQGLGNAQPSLLTKGNHFKPFLVPGAESHRSYYANGSAKITRVRIKYVPAIVPPSCRERMCLNATHCFGRRWRSPGSTSTRRGSASPRPAPTSKPTPRLPTRRAS
jgi:hypothetical protein